MSVKRPVPPKKAKARRSDVPGKSSRASRGRAQMQRCSLAASEEISVVDPLYDGDMALSRIHDTVLKSLDSVSMADTEVLRAVAAVRGEYGEFMGPPLEEPSLGMPSAEGGNRIGFPEGSDVSLGGGYSIATGAPNIPSSCSVVQDLWHKASKLNHPLKLKLADQAGDCYYMPREVKKREQKLDLSSVLEPPPTTDATVIPEPPPITAQNRKVQKEIQRRVKAMVTKEILRGRDADVDRRLFAPFRGKDAEENRRNIEILLERVSRNKLREKKEKALAKKRERAIADGTYVSDEVLLGLKKHPDVIAAEEAARAHEEFLRNDDGSAAYDATLEPCYDNIWADSGLALNQCRAQVAFQAKLRQKRWLTLLYIQLFQAKLESKAAKLKAQHERELAEANRHVWTDDDTAACTIQVAWKSKLDRDERGGSAPLTSRWLRAKKVMEKKRENMMYADPSRAAAYRGVGSEYARNLLYERTTAAGTIAGFITEVFRSNKLKTYVTMFMNGIKVFQGIVRRHLRVNRARMEALNKLFDSFSARLTNHVHVLCEDDLGLDLIEAANSTVIRGRLVVDKRGVTSDRRAMFNILRSNLLPGGCKPNLDQHIRALRGMKTAAFHSLIRQKLPRGNAIYPNPGDKDMSSCDLITLDNLNYELQIHQGYYMLPQPLKVPELSQLSTEINTEDEIGVGSGESTHGDTDIPALQKSATSSSHAIAATTETINDMDHGIHGENNEQFVSKIVTMKDTAPKKSKRNGAGSLIDPDVRKQVLQAFMFKRRREFVTKLTRKFQNGDISERKIRKKSHNGLIHPSVALGATGLNGVKRGSSKKLTPHSTSQNSKSDVQNDASESDEEEEKEVDLELTKEMVLAFIRGGSSEPDPLASKLDMYERKKEEAKRLVAWQKKTRMCNLTCLTTWNTMLSEVRPRDLFNLYLQMVVQTRKKREEVNEWQNLQ